METIVAATKAFFARALTPAPETPNGDFTRFLVYAFGFVYYVVRLIIGHMDSLHWLFVAGVAVLCARFAGVTLANAIRVLLDELHEDLHEDLTEDLVQYTVCIQGPQAGLDSENAK